VPAKLGLKAGVSRGRVEADGDDHQVHLGVQARRIDGEDMSDSAARCGVAVLTGAPKRTGGSLGWL